MVGVPVGYLIAWLARDELVVGRKWFRVLIISSLFIGVMFYFLKKLYVSLTMVFVIIVSAISLVKSYDRRFVKREK